MATVARRDVAWLGSTATPVASAARTASGDSGPQAGYGPAKTLVVQVDVTAVAGTGPTLDVVVEDTVDGTNWHQVASFGQRTAPGVDVVRITTPFAPTLRVRWAIGGTTPSFTFAVMWVAEP